MPTKAIHEAHDPHSVRNATAVVRQQRLRVSLRRHVRPKLRVSPQPPSLLPRAQRVRRRKTDTALLRALHNVPRCLRRVVAIRGE